MTNDVIFNEEDENYKAQFKIAEDIGILTLKGRGLPETFFEVNTLPTQAELDAWKTVEKVESKDVRPPSIFQYTNVAAYEHINKAIFDSSSSYMLVTEILSDATARFMKNVASFSGCIDSITSNFTITINHVLEEISK